jgi:hypothetical protein
VDIELYDILHAIGHQSRMVGLESRIRELTVSDPRRSSSLILMPVRIYATQIKGLLLNSKTKEELYLL